MKIFYITIAIISIMLISLFLLLNVFNSSADDLIAILENMVENVQGENWGKSQDLYAEFDKKWMDTKEFWATLVDHQELDEINTSITKVKYYNLENKSMETLIELEYMIRFIQHLKEKERLTISNLF